MTTYNNVQAQTQASEPLTTSLVTALDRNLYALLEGDPTATGYAQLQELGIQDLAVTPAKLPDVVAPTSTSLGVFENAVPVSSVALVVDPRTSTTGTNQTFEQELTRGGTYTFFLNSSITRSSGDMIVKVSLVVDGVVEASNTYSSGNYYRDQATVTVNAGDLWYIKEERISGTGSVKSYSQCVSLVAKESSTDELYIDRGLWQIFTPTNTNYVQGFDPFTNWNDLSNYQSELGWYAYTSLTSTVPSSQNAIP